MKVFLVISLRRMAGTGAAYTAFVAAPLDKTFPVSKLHLKMAQFIDIKKSVRSIPVNILFFSSFIITLAASSGELNVTVWRPSVRLSVCLSRLFSNLNRARNAILNVPYQGAARDASDAAEDIFLANSPFTL